MPLLDGIDDDDDEAPAAGDERLAKVLPIKREPRTTDKVAAYVGVGRKTLEKAEAIVRLPEAQPERFGGLVVDMDRTGRVDGPATRLKAGVSVRSNPH
jgi:hypothetical protein